MSPFIPEPMLLIDLLRDENVPADAANILVTGITLDSRSVQAGDLFIALKGLVHDGLTFIPAAVANGAVAVLIAEESDKKEASVNISVPIIVVPELAQKLSGIAGHFYGNPSEKLNLIGVTGTNGKSTCVHLLAQMAEGLGRKSASIGTLGIFCEHILHSDFAMTTPDAIACQKTLAHLRANEVSTVAMEVSSHGLTQHRVSALNFRAAIFTNLSHDHLDYHGDMQTYATAKAKLFAMPNLQFAVINKDDRYANVISKNASASAAVLFYSLNDPTADVYVSNIQLREAITVFDIKTPWGATQISTPLLGLFNVYNLTAVITTLCAQGASFEHAAALCTQLHAVPGRMQAVNHTAVGVAVVVDYAHTPDALEKALIASRAHTRNRLWCVFGCGGDRDVQKRAQMAMIAERVADHVVVTSDNPRSESPLKIIQDICEGFTRIQPIVEEDRAKAIAYAIANAAEGDVVLVAGKGHEQYQIFGDARIYFSDVDSANEALNLRSQQQAAGGS